MTASRRAEDGSPVEVAVTVADYFAMLGHELKGESYTKKEHNRRLRLLLPNRTAGAIEFKHANISAVLIQLGLPYIDGYKPRANYQELLKMEVLARLEQEPAIIAATQELVDAPIFEQPEPNPLELVFASPPARHPDSTPLYERRQPMHAVPRITIYSEREARNSSLGETGEAFVLAVEHRRLWEAGCRQLAERLDHVSLTQGDGLGYDIVSFDNDGRERFIEVKTTSFGSMTPFFASAREVAVSEAIATQYHLYRVFKFREAPRIFTLQGSLRNNCALDPVQFRVSLA